MTTGRFGKFGGRFVPEALIPALEQLDEVRLKAMVDPEFVGELERLHRTYTGRPSIITEVPRFAEHAGGARVILKREDLNHTGSHKINNVLGQALLTKRMGKSRVIAETGAGQHGVATATAAALLGLDCTVYMGKVDTERQALNVARMRLLGAEVIPVTNGSQTLKDAVNEALRDWVASVDDTHYVLGTVTGPHPFPEMVRDFHRIIGIEARGQVLDLVGRLPDVVLACVGGGSNAMGIFHRFIDDTGVRLVGLEAGGEGVASGRHASRFASGIPGVLHGAFTYVMQDEDGQTVESHSVSAGLDYPERRPGARLPAGERPRGVPLHHRRPGHGGVPAALPHRGHHPGHRVQPRAGGRHGGRARARPRRRAAGQPLRPRRQGRPHRGDLVRPAGRRRAAGGAAREGHGDPGVSVRDTIDACLAEGRPALVGYLPVGYPDVPSSIAAMTAMVDAGVDIVEIGLPYSDPLMDGPLIQRAAEGALAAGMRVDDVFTACQAVADAGAPALVMTYWNPVLRRGVDAFARDLAASGATGLITPDLIPDEAADWIAASDAYGLDRVFLVAPSSTPERLVRATAASRGFVYAASLMGVTGTRESVGTAAESLVARTRAVTDVPVCVGIGVSNGDQAAAVGAFADGVIVGSALVRTLVDAATPEEGIGRLRDVVADLAQGVRRSRERVPTS